MGIVNLGNFFLIQFWVTGAEVSFCLESPEKNQKQPITNFSIIESKTG
jgi:hypothetical protein